MKKELITNEWYTELVEECKAIISEAHFSASIEVVKGKWELGKRIEEEDKNFERAGYGKKIIEILSRELDISEQTLWKCIQFYKKFPEKKFESIIGKLGDGKTPSWHYVCQNLLPAHKEQQDNEKCEHINLLCLKCRKRFKKGEI